MKKQETLDILTNFVNGCDLIPQKNKKGVLDGINDLYWDFLDQKTDKINSEGNVYCNYFKRYLEPSKFSLKEGKYKSYCNEAIKIRSRIRNYSAKLIRENHKKHQNGIIDLEQFSAINDKIDSLNTTIFKSLAELKIFLDTLSK